MRLLRRCEKEGCQNDSTCVVISYLLGWGWFYCAEHEAEKTPDEVSVALPAPPAE